MVSSLYYLLDDLEEKKKRQLVKGVLSIYLGEAGPEIIDYFLKYGAATTRILMRELGFSKQTISHNLENLEALGFVERQTPEIVDKRLTRRGPKEKVWILKGATAQSVELAHIKDLRLRNPERAKRLEEEDAADEETRKALKKVDKTPISQELMDWAEGLLAKDQQGPHGRKFWSSELKRLKPEMPWSEREPIAIWMANTQSERANQSGGP